LTPTHQYPAKVVRSTILLLFQPKLTNAGAGKVAGMVPLRTDELLKFGLDGVIPPGIGLMLDVYVKLTKFAQASGWPGV
jgi:hypothetical protein